MEFCGQKTTKKKGVLEMIEKPEWYDYAVFDEEGNLKGIKDDAPEKIKKLYEEYLKEELNRIKGYLKY